MAISEIRELRTEPKSARVSARGFVEDVTLSVVEGLPRALFAQLAVLMHYARFAGIGQRTTECWGQVEVSC